MEPRNSQWINQSMIVNGGNNSGNFSVRNHNEPDTTEIYGIIREIRGWLRQQGNVADESSAESALDEFDDALTDRDVPSRYYRLRTALANLRAAVGEAVASALPLVQLANAIENLLQPKH